MDIDIQILRLPIIITYKDNVFCAEIIGKTAPFNRYFTCRIPGADMLVIEALPSEVSGKYTWGICHGKELGYLLPFIGMEIEKHLNRDANALLLQ